MNLDHHYTLTITCQSPPRLFTIGAGGDLPVITVHGDFRTVSEALHAVDSDGSALQQLNRFEQSLSVDDPRPAVD